MLPQRRPWGASAKGVKGDEPTAFDRRLAHRDAARKARATLQADQRLVAARRKAAPSGAADLDAVRNPARCPDARTRRCHGPFADGISRARGEQDMLRQSPLCGEVEPGRRCA
jgi:hypothetical protein